MKRILITTLFALTSTTISVAHGATYSVQPVQKYEDVDNYTDCPAGPCASFTTAMDFLGSFSVPIALPPNQTSKSLVGMLSNFSFSDGINTYQMGDPAIRIHSFQVATDSAGAISTFEIRILKWQTGSSPHVNGDRFAVMDFSSSYGPGWVAASNNQKCITVGPAPYYSVPDSCVNGAAPGTANRSDGTSAARFGAASFVTIPTTSSNPVPTLNEWGMLLMSLLLAVSGGWYGLRKNRRP